jgi:hypothetical protein
VDVERRQIDDNGILNAQILNPTATILDPATFSPVVDRGFTPTPQQRTTISPRMDYQLSTNNTLSVRYAYLDLNRSLSDVGQYILPGTGYGYVQLQQLVQLTEIAVLSSSIVNETAFNSTITRRLRARSPTLPGLRFRKRL